MTARSYTMLTITMIAAGIVVGAIIPVAGFATWINPRHGTAIYLGVFLALAAAAFPVLCRVLRRAERAWDALWNEDGQS